MLELRSVERQIGRAAAEMGALVRLGVDVIVTSSPEMVREAKRATRSVPIVMFSRAPVEEELVPSGRPRRGKTSGAQRKRRK